MILKLQLHFKQNQDLMVNGGNGNFKMEHCKMINLQ